ncbi:MAG: 23 protein [Chloroflexi bacterium]|nr:23 protein [Chloroflexota bacterium]
MRITRLRLENLRRHRALDLELARGLTVVRGPNESGKTTIQRAIELGLTRRVTSASADIDGLRSWGAGEEARPVVRIEFEQDEEDTTKAGFVEKVFRGPKGAVKMEYDGQSIGDPALADQVLAELTGVPTEAFFRSTASVRHHEVDDVSRDEGALKDRLQASISGADRGTSRARKKLEKALYDLNTKGDKNPGRLKVAEAAVTQALAGVELGEAALAQLERDRDRLSIARERRAEADGALAERRSLLEKARQAERLVVERDAAQEKFERYRTAVAVSDELAVMGESHPAKDPLPVLRTTLAKLRAIDGRLRELRAMLSGEVEVHYEVEAPEPRSWRPVAIVAIVLILAGIALAAAGQFAVVALPGGLGVPLAMVGGGLVLALVGRRQRISATGFQRQKQMRDIDIDRRLRGRSLLEQELQEAELEFANQHVSRMEVLAAQLEGLVGREPPDTLPGRRDSAALEVDQKSGALEALGPIAKEPRARERLEVEVKDSENEVEAARDEEANARAKVEQNPVDAEEVAALAERLAQEQERQAMLQRRARVYDLTLKAIDVAERATMRTATRYLEKHMVGDLAAVTDGRYRRVRVDDASLGIQVFAPERGDWVDVTALSQGTLDLVYLAARIGLVRLVTGDRRPPLVLDDPFVTLDDDRARRALELLRRVSADFQIIYLTTSDRYDAAADLVRVLDAPTAVDKEAAGAA